MTKHKGISEAVNKVTEIHSVKSLAIVLPIIGMLISAVFMLERDEVVWGDVINRLIYGIIITSVLWLGCLMIVTYLWRTYPWEHNPVKHLIIEVIAIFLYATIFGSFVDYLAAACGLIEQPINNFLNELVVTIFLSFFITALYEAVFFYRQWKFNFSKSVQLQKQQIEAQYELLKAQTNPHFMFNSLNNLVSIVDENPLAVEYINQMSGFLRYMLKSNDQELVSVQEELSMLDKYNYLHQIRFGDILEIEIQVEHACLAYRLPPLVLQMLVENCLKHNILARNKPLHIQIYSQDEYIIVKNNLNLKFGVDSTGQGLKNITERFRYFTSNDVKVNENDTCFKVAVPLIK